MQKVRLRRGCLTGLAATAVVLLAVTPASAAPGDGSAYGAQVNVTVLSVAANVGPLAPSNTNGPTSNAVVQAATPVGTIGAVTTSAVRDDATGAVDAKGEVAGADIGLAGLKLTASTIAAECHATQSGVSGTSTLANIAASLAGLPITIPVNPAPNTTIAIGTASALGLPAINVAKLVLNEQISNPDGSLTVNAIHLTLLGGALNPVGSGDLVLASATCGPAGLPIPMASGAGLWLGLGLLAVATSAVLVVRRRRGAITVTA